jgi:hypothetical protein
MFNAILGVYLSKKHLLESLLIKKDERKANLVEKESYMRIGALRR